MYTMVYPGCSRGVYTREVSLSSIPRGVYTGCTSPPRSIPRVYSTHQCIAQGVQYPPAYSPGCTSRVAHPKGVPQGLPILRVYLSGCHSPMGVPQWVSLSHGCTSQVCPYRSVYLSGVSLPQCVPQGVLTVVYTSGCANSGLYLRVSFPWAIP